MNNPHRDSMLSNPSRRHFVQGMVAGGVLLGSGLAGSKAWALGGVTPPRELKGTEFDLEIAELPVNFTGKPRIATAINGQVPGPILRWREGDTVTLRVSNRLSVPTSLHWHGILVPNAMDGVPGLTFDGIAPGETFVYRFKVRQSGTYWYHSHSGFQEQTGMYGAIVIDPAQKDRIQAERDYVVQLSDWTDEDPSWVLHKLKAQSDYYNFIQPTVGDFFRDVSRNGLRATLDDRRMWQQMRMNPTDLADVSAYTYTYLMNGTAPAGNWTGLFKSGERVRLRFISSGAMTFFDVRIPGLKMTVVQADGQDVEPVTVDEFRIGPGETCDVVVTPKDEAYTIFAQSMDRSGYACGTLAPRAGMTAAIPALDKVEPLEMEDMMGDMTSNIRAHHARTEYGPSVDMRVDTPRTNLDDPGVGLRDNGRRVLTYADLHTLGGPIDPRGSGREMELHLTGNMERYVWSIDGVEFGRSKPIRFRYNERLRVVFVNDTMMTHPMHLHGMWSELENPDGGFQVRKHTIAVQPAQRVSFLVSADALGRWAWHCHLMFHMDTGMFREVLVA